MKETRDSEISFYQKVYEDDLGIKEFMPSFFGVEGNQIKIENLLHELDNPNIIDLKMG